MFVNFPLLSKGGRGATDMGTNVKIQNPNLTPNSSNSTTQTSSGAQGIGGSQRVDQANRGDGRAGQVGGRGDGDRIELSGLSARLGGGDLGVEDQSPEKTARLTEVSKLVESGKYRPDAKEVASRIVDEAIVG